MSEAPITLMTPGSNIMEVRTKARRLQSRHGVVNRRGLFAVNGRPEYGKPRAGSFEISRSLKLLARELNIPVLALVPAVPWRGKQTRQSSATG